MAYKYIVVHPFHGYDKGQEVTDPDEIAKVLADNEPHVVRVFVPDAPFNVAPADKPATKSKTKEGA